RSRCSDRKLRLFACACCRTAWRLLQKPCRRAVEVAEAFADEETTPADLKRAQGLARELEIDPEPDKLWIAANSVIEATDPNAQEAAENALLEILGLTGRGQTARASRLASLPHDVFGNPFRAIALDRSWRPATTISLAQAAYKERLRDGGHLDPARLLILADALEEAGCTNAAIPDHLREPGPHVRGCWAVDLVLAKE